MADTQRSRSSILTLFADNLSGQISAQDLRDFVVTVMNAEFAYTGDFWAKPDSANLTSEGGRGWFLYSQACDSDMSFGNILYLTPSGTWKRALGSDSDMNAVLAVAMSVISSDDSGVLLKEGLIFHSVYSGIFSGYIGKPIYLESTVLGSICGPGSTAPTSAKIVGYIEDDTNGIYRFGPDWSIVGT